jgi:hypothetical protein
MRNSIDIDYSHSRAIVREIGERLRASLEIDRELPASLRTQIDRLRHSEGEPQQNIAGWTPPTDVKPGDRAKGLWPLLLLRRITPH